MKNWICPDNIVYQEEEIPGYVAVEDLIKEEMEKRWQSLVEQLPIFTPLSYEILERMRVILLEPMD